MVEKLYIIDSLSPFFLKCGKSVVNWSKIPFDSFELRSKKVNKSFKKVLVRTELYFKSVASLGYNSVSIDDLAHLTIFDFYSEKLKRKISIYRKYYNKIFLLAEKYGLKVFINSDIMFFNKNIEYYIKRKKLNIETLLRKSINDLFSDFPKLEGVNFRIGESDGVDVKGEFHSKVIIKTAASLNKIIKRILPVFEKNNKYLIVRTWTMGAYQIGDLSWNIKTFNKAFDGIAYDKFIVSMKYADADFFRYLELNQLFSSTSCNKIIELQTRREYEGHGSYPSYIGFYYDNFFKELSNNNKIVGIHVWCQTGGWSSFYNRTFSKNKSSIWNEINTVATIKIFKDKLNSSEVIKFISRDYLKIYDYKKLEKFLSLSDVVINDLLYDPGFAKNSLYFNKLRIPTLFYVFWDTVILNKFIINIFRTFNTKPEDTIMVGEKALLSINEMRNIAKEINITYDYRFHYKTFKIILYIRKLLYSTDSKAIVIKLKKLIREYRDEYPFGYNFKIDYKLFDDKAPCKSVSNKSFIFFTKMFLRDEKDFRRIDYILFNPLFRFIIRIGLKLFKRNLPSIAGKRGMDLQFFLK